VRQGGSSGGSFFEEIWKIEGLAGQEADAAGVDADCDFKV
jgi:hypothetical protein